MGRASTTAIRGRWRLAIAALLPVLAIATGTASAGDGSGEPEVAGAEFAPSGPQAVSAGAPGGTAAPGDPRIGAVGCLSRCIGPTAGIVRSRVRITGSDLGDTVMVSFPGRRGKRARDRSPVVKPSGAVLAKVPRKARSGLVRVADSFGQFNDSATVFIVGTKAQLRAARQGYMFPVRGPHTFGGPEARFGAPRTGHTHQGHDIFAACGTILAVAHSGVVKAAGFQAAAGNYVIIDGADVEQDYGYMHLLNPTPLAVGQAVITGQKVGKIGVTGNSTGCHLHFEIWAGAGWYTGGAPIDPLPSLLYWDGFS
jgi:Peptidase family M23